MNRLKNTVEFWCKIAESTLDFIYLHCVSLTHPVRKDSEKKKEIPTSIQNKRGQ